ncbi:MAG TPA: penicillin-binding transpeptidase domain-containing protein [Terriglobales bacterium]|nr:penicillin-binding transpeptidase domain-containing protein [Terriglobales bacterium]
MGSGSRVANLFWVLVVVASLALSVSAATVSGRTHKKTTAKVTENARTQRRMRSLRHSRTVAGSRASRARLRRVHHRYYERFYTSSFAENQDALDAKGGEDPVVRQAAIEALGDMNGTVVAVDPDTGRILAMVNQPLALSEGAQPCSTIKLSVALAALSEGIVTKDTKINVGGWRLNMTEALAHSNNAYFEALGRKLGFERVAYYSHQFGLGELAGYHIAGEHLGTYPSEEIDQKLGGVGRMCSFGEGVSMTPLQLAALVSAIANGGTLYYLQHPTTPDEVANFKPMVKRHLDIGGVIPQILDGMAGAVRYGTARSVRYNFSEQEILGKTGTCSKDGTRFGWFASFANTDRGKIVVVMFLRGGRPTFGPKAAELTGVMYKDLNDHNYFAGPVVPQVERATQTVGVSQ